MGGLSKAIDVEYTYIYVCSCHLCNNSSNSRIQSKFFRLVLNYN